MKCKLNYTIVFCIIFWISLNLLCSIFVFTNGFLLRRTTLNTTNDISYTRLKRFNKTVILFIDALRYDFVFTSNKSSIYGLKTIESLLSEKPTQSKLFKFIADVRNDLKLSF